MRRLGHLFNFSLFILVLFLPLGHIILADSSPPTCVIQGTVRDKVSKQPIPKATVLLQSFSTKSTITDENGFFKFDDAPQFMCAIQATGPDIYCPRLMIDASNQDTVNIILETKPGGKLSGTVTDIQNNPILNANVDYSQTNNYSTQKTNDKGEFSFSGLDLDSPISSVRVIAEGFQLSFKNNIDFPTGEKEITLTFQLSSAAIDTTNGAEKITVSGDVMDSSGNPVNNARVANGTRNTDDHRVTRTDNNGRFVLTDIPVLKQNNQLQFENLVFFSVATGYAPDWKQMSSEQDTVLHFILPDAHFVAGKVVDSDGNPIPDVMGQGVIIPKLERANRETWNYEWNLVFSSDSEGLFHLNDLSKENTKFDFFKSGYTPIENTTLSIDKDDNVVTLSPAGQISGIVIDDITGKPINSFKVYAAPPKDSDPNNSYYYNGHNALSFTPDDGKFTLSNLMFFIHTPNLGSNVLVAVDADGYQHEEIDRVPVQKPPFKETDRLVFRMKKTLPAQGIVVDSSIGKGIPDVKVTALISPNGNRGSYEYYQWDNNAGFMQQQSTLFKTTTDATGRFQFNGLSSATGTVTLEKQGYGRSLFTQVDFTQFLQFKLPRAGSITVLFGDKSTLSQDSIGTYLNKNETMGGSMFGFKNLNDEGKIIYTDLPPGDFYLQINRKNTIVHKNVKLLEGQNLVLDLSTSSYIKVYGTIRYKGNPMEGVSVRADLKDLSNLDAGGDGNSGKDGKYELLLSTPGKYGIAFNKWEEHPPYKYAYKTLAIETGEYKLDINFPDSVIKGLLLNTKTGKPIPQVPIAAYRKKRAEDIPNTPLHMEYSNSIWSRFNTATTNDNGQFSMDNLDAGEWLVAEEIAPDNACSGKPFQLLANQTKDNLVFLLPETGSLAVSVLDEDSGNTILPLEMGCKDSTGYVYQPVLIKSTTQYPYEDVPLKIATDSTGKAYFSSLPVGQYTLYARTDNHPTASTTLEILPDKQTQSVLKLKKGGRLTFPLKEKIADGEMLYCNCKILVAKTGKPVMQDAAGTYKRALFYINIVTQDTCHVIPLPPGDYTVELQLSYYTNSGRNNSRKPVTLTKLMKIEEDKDTAWDFSIANFRK